MQEEEKPVDENEKVQNKIVFTINMLNFLSTFLTCYQMIFFPIIAKYEAGLSYTQIGIIQSTGSFGWLFLSIPLSNLLKKIGIQKSFKLCLLLVFLTVIENSTFQLLTFNKVLFFIFALIGYAMNGVLRCYFIIISLNQIELGFPHKFQEKYSRFEMYAGVGSLAGPIIGNFLNYLLGYSIPILIIAGADALFAVYLLKVRNEAQQEKEVFSDDKVPYRKLFSSAKVLTTMLAGMLSQGTFIFVMPFLNNHVLSYGYGPQTFGLILGIPMIMNIVILPAVPRISKVLRNNITLSLALSLSILGNLIDSPFWGNVQNFPAFLIGLIIVGASVPLYRVPSVPLQMENIQVVLDINSKADLNRIASSLLTTQIGLTNLVMPTLGGALYDTFNNGQNDLLSEIIDYRKTILTFASIQAVGLFVFIIFGGCKNITQVFRRMELENKQNELQKELVINKSSFETLETFDQEMQAN